MAPAPLALPWYGAGDTPLEEPLVLCGTCAMGSKTVQNAGKAFWERFEEPLMVASPKHRGRTQDTDRDGEEKFETERERAFREKREKKQRESKGKDGGLLKMSEDLKGQDLFELLELEPGASGEELKKSYRQLVLKSHPDKLENPTEAQKKRFLLIQEAYEIISDPDKRRRYECTLDFDDSVPTGFGRGKLADADFYETFRPVFKRNARWSARPKVPGLGDETTDIKDVKAFYDFWYNFETWRDPLAMAEKEEEELHNLEEAECREERRWMERENARVAKRYAAAERERLSELVKVAEKNDPRMIRYKEEQRALKEAEKAKKAAALRAEQEKREAEARAKAEAEAAIRREEEARRQEERKRKEEAKNALKAARQRLRSLHKHADAMVRHNVHVDQLQEVCLRLGTEELHGFCEQLEGLLKDVAGAEFGEVIALLHGEIEKGGARPIVDPSVDPTGKAGGSGASTASGDSEDLDDSGLDLSPAKPPRELTPEELEAERLRKIAEEAAERERQERRAEEQRKKRELQRKEEEKRQAALRKLEKKEAEAAKKQSQKEQKKLEQEAKQAEEQRLRQLQQAEEQRQAALQEEQDRRRAHEEQIVARAFEMDRFQRLAILEAYDDGVFETALRSTLLQEGTEQPAVRLIAALKQIAATLPPPATSKAEAADQDRKDVEELCVDTALGCLNVEGGADAGPEEARARLARALALAVRPPRSTPELSKDAKASVKKQRNRVRGAVLKLLRAMQPAEAVAAPPAAKVAASATAPKPEAVKAGTELIAAEEGTLYESMDSYTDIGVVAEGKVVVASGPPAEVEGFPMVPVKPRGAVELRVLRLVAPAPAADAKAAKGAAAKPGKGAGAGAGKKAPEPELDGRLLEFVRLAKQGPSLQEAAEDDFLQACYGGFDPDAALAEAAGAKAKAEPEKEAPKEAAGKAGKKAKKAEKPGEEDLDALLEEFGATPSPSKSKKKGKK